jgi:Minor capsid protein
VDISVSWTSNFDGSALDKITSNQAIGSFAATSAATIMGDYVPFLAGDLKGSAIISPWHVKYTQPYAKYQYYGDGFNFTTDFNPKARSHWDEPLKTTHLAQFTDEISNYIKRVL